MINPAPEIRKALNTLLSGAITYNSAVVPVREDDGGQLSEYQIFIGGMSYNDEGTKHTFDGRVNQIIEVVTEVKGTSTSKHADAIAAEVLDLIFPTPRTTGIAITGFKPCRISKNLRMLKEQGTNSTVVRRIIELNFIL
jgi:hypothetical protein